MATTTQRIELVKAAMKNLTMAKALIKESVKNTPHSFYTETHTLSFLDALIWSEDQNSLLTLVKDLQATDFEKTKESKTNV